jgi:cell division protein FtsZ
MPRTTRFASEAEFEVPPTLNLTDSAEPVVEAQRATSWIDRGTSPELVPVPASVFDDDFFHSPEHGEIAGPTAAEEFSERFREGGHFSVPVRVQQQENVRVVTAETVVADNTIRGSSFGDAAVASTESDELDIPAFLRRGN